MAREQINIVVVGHVDHGKSTVIGRMLADTDSLPEGKLEDIKERCKRESKQFEYAFLLDALKDEQSQGITIDSARCFFKTKKRDYIIIDAPGHIEFLKNMISGAARAEAAVLVIDANEGVQENSRRHGYMLSLLGITRIVVCINKMDLVNYDQKIYESIKKEYSDFLKKINITPAEFIPVSATEGDNIAKNTKNISWFKGNTVLSALDLFEKEKSLDEKPFRFPVQDVYKFTGFGDDRRIVAGRILSGKIKEGDKVVFLPSNKRSTIKSIEGFNTGDRDSIASGYSTGFTLTEQIYVKRGEIMCREDEILSKISSEIHTSIFWMGLNPMEINKEYKLKLGTASIQCRIKEIKHVLDASNLNNSKKKKIDRHEVADCVLTLQSPIAFDLIHDLQSSGRFVIVDDYEIAGGGIITEYLPDKMAEYRKKALIREQKWDRGFITSMQRSLNYGQTPKLILITGKTGIDKKSIAWHLEKNLFEEGRKVYFLGIRNLLRGLDSDIEKSKREEHIRRLGEVSHILLDAGLIVIATASDLISDELKLLKTVTSQDDLIIIHVGAENGSNELADLVLAEEEDADSNIARIMDILKFRRVIFGY